MSIFFFFKSFSVFGILYFMNFTTKAVALNHGLQMGNLFRIPCKFNFHFIHTLYFFTFELFSYQNHNNNDKGYYEVF